MEKAAKKRWRLTRDEAQVIPGSHGAAGNDRRKIWRVTG